MLYEKLNIKATPGRPFVCAIHNLLEVQVLGWHFINGKQCGLRAITGIEKLEPLMDQLCNNAYILDLNSCGSMRGNSDCCSSDCQNDLVGYQLDNLLTGATVNIALPPLTIEHLAERFSFTKLSEAYASDLLRRSLIELSLDIYAEYWRRRGANVIRYQGIPESD